MTVAETKKRPMAPGDEGLSDSTSRPTKRGKANTHATTSCSVDLFSTQGHFRQVHWRLLQVLYDDEDESLSVDWVNNIQRYLRDRGRVRSLKGGAEHLEGLLEEAVDVLQDDEGRRRSDVNNVSTPLSLWASRTTTGTGGAPYSYYRPNTLGGSQHQQFAPSSTPATSIFSNDTSARKNLRSSSLSSFGLVAGLLQTRVGQAREKLQKSTTPLEPLAEDIVKEIEALERELGEGANPPVTSSDATFGGGESKGSGAEGMDHDDEAAANDESTEEREERLATCETKLRLWKLLLSDLNGP